MILKKIVWGFSSGDVGLYGLLLAFVLFCFCNTRGICWWLKVVFDLKNSPELWSRAQHKHCQAGRDWIINHHIDNVNFLSALRILGQEGKWIDSASKQQLPCFRVQFVESSQTKASDASLTGVYWWGIYSQSSVAWWALGKAILIFIHARYAPHVLVEFFFWSCFLVFASLCHWGLIVLQGFCNDSVTMQKSWRMF